MSLEEKFFVLTVRKRELETNWRKFDDDGDAIFEVTIFEDKNEGRMFAMKRVESFRPKTLTQITFARAVKYSKFLLAFFALKSDYFGLLW